MHPGTARAWLLVLALLPGGVAASAPGDDWLAEAGPLLEAVCLSAHRHKGSDGHARKWVELVAKNRTRWVDPARAFFPRLVPPGLPTRVVYPFGGGDLVGALATFAGATEITTLSLEPAGDVRLLARGKSFEPLLARFRDAFRWFLYNAHSKTTTLSMISGREVPGQLMFWFAGLSMLDHEPLTLRYFKLGPGGEPVYHTRTSGGADRFDNAELTFRKRGRPDAPVITYRHLRANLDDTHWRACPELRAHLESKGRIAAMTKAASFLLWSSEFSGVRDYLLGHAEWMVSDSTGIPPRLAGPAGFTQVTYGRFDGPCLPASPSEVNAFKALWARQPQRPLPFRYGYPDAKRQNHLLVTARCAPARAAP